MHVPRCLLAAALALFAGCGPESALEVRPPSLAEPSDTSDAAPELNGTSVVLGAPAKGNQCALPVSRTGEPLPYGCSNNGPLLASTLAWVTLGSATAADGTPLGAVSLQGGFSGSLNGASVQGGDFAGARFTGVLTDGSAVSLRIDSATSGSGAQAGVWRYGFSYQDSTGAWRALCANGNPAVVVLGRWDYHQGAPGGGAKVNDPTVFTVGCQGSAVEKCVRAGYMPWAAAGGVSLDAHHQACVRMIRADYCGNGLSQTTDGRAVNLYDQLGIQADTQTWLMEAEWTPAGARCVNLLNRSLLGVLCAPLLATVTCGSPSHFSTGTLLMSETPLGQVGGLL